MRTLSLLLLASLASASSLLACGGPTAEPSTPNASSSSSASASATPTAAPPAPVASAGPTKPNDEPKADVGPAKPPEAMLPTVKVVDAGAAPRKALRYKFKAGTTEYVEMDMKMSMGMAMGAKAAPRTDLPTVRTLMRIEAKELTPEGDLRCAFSADKVDVLKDVQVDPKLRGAVEKEMAGVVGMHGRARISPRGVATETEFDLAPGASETVKGQMDTMRDAIRQMYIPFPEEEVGKGAKWDVTSRIPLGGALIDSKMAYTLTKLEADRAEADIAITMTAPPNQPMQIGALPPGATATLDGVSGTGAGKVSPSFVHLVGTSSSKISMESSFSVAMKGEKAQMKMLSDVTAASRPAKAPAVAPAKK
jgi:hypothetical protein